MLILTRRVGEMVMIGDEVTVTVLAPPDARPGLYAGILSATGDETFAIGIQAEVY